MPEGMISGNLFEAIGLCISALLLLEYTVFAARCSRQYPADPSNDRPTAPGDATAAPELTVLIPCRNEAERLPAVLQDLANQTVRVELLVIDDGSEDATVELATQAGVPVLRSPGHGKKAALAAGFAATRTPWLATVDADVRLAPNWACALLAARMSPHAPPASAVLGPVIISCAMHSGWERFQAQEYAAMMLWIGGGVASGGLAMGSGANSLYRTADYPVDALHPEQASGDDGFALLALRIAGKHIAWCSASAAIATTQPAPSWNALWQQRARWASKTGGQDSGTRRAALRVAAHHGVGLAWVIAAVVAGSGAVCGMAVAFWAGKAAVDGLMIHRASRRFGIPVCRVDYVTFTLRYGALVFGAWWQLLSGKVEWKGRSI